MNIKSYLLVVALAVFTSGVIAKIPPPPPLDPVAAATKAEKDKAAADKAKADVDKGKLDLARYEDKAVINFQGNMKKTGKPVPKPTPIVVVVMPAVVPASATTPSTALSKPAAPGAMPVKK